MTSFCADINVSGTDITLFCQTLVDAGGAGGDSGSPVFAWDGGYSAWRPCTASCGA